ncbi:hypothetical protein JKP88DRAFT_219329 [Tribonema minus]|uniref:Uncharacterized protein n=1 Tax=Tribonema minus TaxID=303371 RepID=A0A835Z461_9STRA|nr:hypothetical protein JKP88DRAFT_219329 [Tribonema minus]
MGLASTDAQKAQAMRFIGSRKRAAETGKQPIADPEIVLDTELDLQKRTFKVVRARVASASEATLASIDSVLELQLEAAAPPLQAVDDAQQAGEPAADPTEAAADRLQALCGTFVSLNSLPAGLAGAAVMQEVYSLGYAVRVAASNIPGWKGTVAGRPLPLPATEDLLAVLGDLFGDAGAAKKKGVKNAAKSKSKSPPKRHKAKAK